MNVLFIVLTESFLPKLYEKYVEENVPFKSFFKKYYSHIIWFL